MGRNNDIFRRLASVSDAHLEAMMRWFPSGPLLRQRAGLGVRFPFYREFFEADLNLNRLASHVLVDQLGQIQISLAAAKASINDSDQHVALWTADPQTFTEMD